MLYVNIFCVMLSLITAAWCANNSKLSTWVVMLNVFAAAFNFDVVLHVLTR